jgi:hypothetical protein
MVVLCSGEKLSNRLEVVLKFLIQTVPITGKKVSSSETNRNIRNAQRVRLHVERAWEGQPVRPSTLY